MSDHRVDSLWLRRVAGKEGFHQDAFERAYRLGLLLADVSRHPYLGPRLVLKGGTCINFFHAGLPRLSVDVDLNYIRAVRRETMLEEKPRVKDAFLQLMKSLGYGTDVIFDEHAGWSVRFLYENAHGSEDGLKADVNFLQRLSLYDTEVKPLPPIFEIEAPFVRVVSVEEAYGGKLTALAVRGEPRDVFDAAHFFSGSVPHDPDRLRKAFLFFASMDDATLRTVDVPAIERLDEKAFQNRLLPMLRRGIRPDGKALVAGVLPHLKGLLALDQAEEKFGRLLESGKYEPGLLFGKVPVNPSIRDHPAAEWRRQNPHARAPLEP